MIKILIDYIIINLKCKCIYHLKPSPVVTSKKVLLPLQEIMILVIQRLEQLRNFMRYS